MQNGLVSFDEAVGLLSSGRYFTVAADEALLRKLPAGHWIGGSTPYFVGHEGGESSREKVFITELPTLGGTPEIRFYTPEQLPRVFLDAPENGFSLIIIPAFSQAHLDFARHAPDYEEAFLKPLTGWISGMHLDDLGSAQAMVVNGQRQEFSNVAAVVMHVPLPDDKLAEINIVNLFHPGQGPAIRFPSTGFTAGDCLIDGHPANLADYLLAQNADTSVPLVADYCGAMINVSIKGIDAATHSVAFYAPVFEDMEYRIADPVKDYVAAFAAAMPAGGGHTAFSCNCILNYLHSDLEGKRTGALAGPVTFGEVAYQLLNQTLVYMTIE
jgi:hypothetical protein